MLERLAVSTFRNLEPTALEPGPGVHLVLGPNGAGKTSLLESIYCLATTRSFRTPRLRDCVQHGADGFVVRGETDARAMLEVIQHADGRERRLGGDRVDLATYLAALPVVAWTATDADLATGPPAERRRFLDRGIVGLRPAAIEAIGRYRQALDGKRRLLAGRSGTGGSSASGRLELESWNGVLARAAAELIERRATYVEALREAFEQILAVCALDLPPIDLRYRPSPAEAIAGVERGGEGAGDGAEDRTVDVAEGSTVATADGGRTRRAAIEDAMHGALDRMLDRERQLEQPLVGPHRDDLEIRWRSLPVKRVASAGERKALGLALLAAHGALLERGERAPVYLLDDVDTELDAVRLASLWRHFGAAGQLFATSNRPAVWGSLAIARRWRVEEGRITADDDG